MPKTPNRKFTNQLAKYEEIEMPAIPLPI